MKQRLLTFAALIAVFGGAGAIAVSRAHAQTLPIASTQQSTTADTKDASESNSEVNDTGKPDTNNVQQEGQNGPQDANEVPDATAPNQ